MIQERMMAMAMTVVPRLCECMLFASFEYYVVRKLTKCKVMIMAKHVIAFYVNEVENLSYTCA